MHYACSLNVSAWLPGSYCAGLVAVYAPLFMKKSFSPPVTQIRYRTHWNSPTHYTHHQAVSSTPLYSITSNDSSLCCLYYHSSGLYESPQWCQRLIAHSGAQLCWIWLTLMIWKDRDGCRLIRISLSKLVQTWRHVIRHTHTEWTWWSNSTIASYTHDGRAFCCRIFMVVKKKKWNGWTCSSSLLTITAYSTSFLFSPTLISDTIVSLDLDFSFFPKTARINL